MTGVVVLLALIAGLAAFAVPKVCQHNQAVVLGSLIERYAFAHVGAEEADGSIFDIGNPEASAREIAAELGGKDCAYGRACPNHCPIGGIFSVTFEQTGDGDAVFMVKCSRHGDGMTDRLTMAELTALLEGLRDYWRERVGGGAPEGRAVAAGRNARFPAAVSALLKEASGRSGSLPAEAEHASQLLERLADLQSGGNEAGDPTGAISLSSMMPRDFPSFLGALRGLVPADAAEFRETEAALERISAGKAGEEAPPPQQAGTAESGGNALAQFLDGLLGDLVPAVRGPASAMPEMNGTAGDGAAENGITWREPGRKEH